MVIKTSYEELTKALSLLGKVIATKGIQEDMKVINLFIKDNVIKAAATDGRIYCLTDLEGSYDLEGLSESESYVAIMVKEVSDILDKFRGLQRTKVSSVELYIRENGIVMTVNEEAKDAEGEDSKLYTQATRFKIVKQQVKRLIQNEIPLMVLPTDAIEVSNKDLQLYLDYLYSPICKPKNPELLHFKDDKVYTIMGHLWGVVMDNKLPTLFRGFSFNHYAVGFLKDIITDSETFKVSKEEVFVPDTSTGEDKLAGVILTMQIGKHILKLKTADETSRATTEPFTPMPTSQVEIDKYYFLDVLKRINTFDTVYITVDLKDGVGTMNVITTKTRQQIPIKAAQGEGLFNFAVNPDHLANVIFAHITKTLDGESLDSLTLGFKHTQDGRVEITCTDHTGLWMTKYPRAPKQEPPRLDF